MRIFIKYFGEKNLLLLKNLGEKTKENGKKFLLKFVPNEERKNNHLYYIIGLIALFLIIGESWWLFSREEEISLEAENPSTVIQTTDNLVIGTPEKNKELLQKFKKELQGVNDSSFESASFASGKNVITVNAETESSADQAQTGKKSLKISWISGQNKSVRLNNYLVTQKDSFYKLGFWISSEKDQLLKLSLINQDTAISIAEIGVLANEKNQFRYYEYNFQAPIEASGLELAVANSETGSLFLDGVKLVPLLIEKKEELVSIQPTLLGANQGKMEGEKQTTLSETSQDLAIPKTLLGQVFSPQVNNLAGATFSLKKIGDGGVGEYTLELREFDSVKHQLSPDRLAMLAFSAGDLKEEKHFFSIFSQLEAGKSYWLGFNNSNVSVDENNHLLLGRANTVSAYFGGDAFLRKNETKTFTQEKDLYFVLNYLNSTNTRTGLPVGQNIYDLGKGQSRVDYLLEATDGTNVLSLEQSQNIFSDKWQNLFLKDDGSFLTYRIFTQQKKVKKMTLVDLSFHNNLKLEFSLDGQNWSEILADNSGSGWQNTGKIEIEFPEQQQDLFLRLKKNGEKSTVFLGGQISLNLQD